MKIAVRDHRRCTTWKILCTSLRSLRLSGKLPIAMGKWELRVLYHNPLALSVGVLEEKEDKNKLTIGGDKGMRYLIRADRVTEHLSSDGALHSDRLTDHHVKSTLLTPKDET